MGYQSSTKWGNSDGEYSDARSVKPSRFSKFKAFIERLIADPVPSKNYWDDKSALQYMESPYRAWVNRKSIGPNYVEDLVQRNPFRPAQESLIKLLHGIFSLPVWAVRTALLLVLLPIKFAAKIDRAIAGMGKVGKAILTPLRLLTFLPYLIDRKRETILKKSDAFMQGMANLLTNLVVVTTNPLFMLLDLVYLVPKMIIKKEAGVFLGDLLKPVDSKINLKSSSDNSLVARLAVAAQFPALIVDWVLEKLLGADESADKYPARALSDNVSNIVRNGGEFVAHTLNATVKFGLFALAIATFPVTFPLAILLGSGLIAGSWIAEACKNRFSKRHGSGLPEGDNSNAPTDDSGFDPYADTPYTGSAYNNHNGETEWNDDFETPSTPTEDYFSKLTFGQS